MHGAAGRGIAGVVAGADRHPRLRVVGVDQAQPAGLRRVAGRVEQRDVVAAPVLPGACGLPGAGEPAGVGGAEHRGVHLRQRAVGAAHIGRRDNGHVGIDREAHIAGKGPEPRGQPLGRVAGLKLRGAELHRRARAERQHGGIRAMARVVDRADGNSRIGIGAVDQAQHALRAAADTGGYEQGNCVLLGVNRDGAPQQEHCEGGANRFFGTVHVENVHVAVIRMIICCRERPA